MRAALVVIALASVTLPAAGRGEAPSGVRLTPLESIRFPDRALVVATAKPLALSGRDVEVRENGSPVRPVSVVPASGASGRAFGVVLVLDASYSMSGRSIAGAVAAARAFVAHRAGAEEIGLITFNRTIHVALPLTSNGDKLSAALRETPQLAVGTRIWDAANGAMRLLQREKITAGSIVLLTDGRDTGSSLGSRDFAARAKSAGIRLFAVGLHSPQFNPGPLSHVAMDTHGAYTEATDPRRLAGIYRALSSQFAREYLVRYRSQAAPGKIVRVEVSVPGAQDAAAWSYRTPEPPAAQVPPFNRSFIDRVVSSPASIALIVLLAAGLAAFAMSSLLKPGRSTVRDRVGEFVAVAAPRSAHVSLPRRALNNSLGAAESALERWWPSWERFKEELEIAEYPVAPVPLAVGTVAGSVLLALLGFVSPVLALLALVPPLTVRASYKGRLRNRRQAFEEQLPENLTVLAASLRAGRGFVSGLNAVLNQADEPSKSELTRAIADEQLGVPIEESLIRVAHRMASGDLEQVALVASLQRETGGNTAEVLDAVVKSIRERAELRRLVKTLTAQGRLSRWVLVGLPIFVAGWITLSRPHYMSPLLHTGIGQVMLTVAIAMVILGSFIVKRITEIEI
jgi:tight adherence protein B